MFILTERTESSPLPDIAGFLISSKSVIYRADSARVLSGWLSGLHEGFVSIISMASFRTNDPNIMSAIGQRVRVSGLSSNFFSTADLRTDKRLITRNPRQAAHVPPFQGNLRLVGAQRVNKLDIPLTGRRMANGFPPMENKFPRDDGHFRNCGSTFNVISKPRAQSIPTSAFAAVDATLTIWFGDLLFHLHRRLGGHHLTG